MIRRTRKGARIALILAAVLLLGGCDTVTPMEDPSSPGALPSIPATPSLIPTSGSSEADSSESESETPPETRSSAESDDTSTESPDTSEPQDSSAPEQTEPQQTEPQQTEPQQTEPQQTQPQQTEPQQTQPQQTEPTQPQPTQPQPTQPTQPTQTQPQPTQPTQTQPQPTQPTQPTQTQPQPTQTQPTQTQPTQPRPTVAPTTAAPTTAAPTTAAPTTAAPTTAAPTTAAPTTAAPPPPEPPKPKYQVPPFQGSGYNPAGVVGNERAHVDISGLPLGYVAVAAESGARLKFQVCYGDIKYTYDIANNGAPSVFPLTCGAGTYKFRVMENIEGTKYGELFSCTADAAIGNPFSPFLRPSAYVNYHPGSACVGLAASFSANASTAVDVVAQVYSYVCSHIRYDAGKAASVQSGYLPNPDATLATGSGICFDYAALAAAMLRSQGIPTKLIFGYVAPNNLYHAWNMFYTAETGWVTVGFSVTPGVWNRLDLTFSANGANPQFIGNGANYADVYQY